MPCALPFVGAARQPSVSMCRSAARAEESAREWRRGEQDEEKTGEVGRWGGDKREELTRWEPKKQTARGGATPLGVTLTAPFAPEAESRVSVGREASIIQVKTRETKGRRRIGRKKTRTNFDVLNANHGVVADCGVTSTHWRDSKSCGGFSSWSEGTHHSGIVCA